MDFYTNVSRSGKYILYRGIENGKRVLRRIEYHPKLYVLAGKQTEFRSLDGKYLAEIEPGNMSDCKEFADQHKDSGYLIYGNQRYEYPFISENFTDHVQWDKDHLKLANIDIEVGSENGFPHPDSASEEITAITLKINEHFYVFGCGDYENKEQDPNISYFKCANERDLIKKFLVIWSKDYPDAVTGWNIKFFDIPYLVNRILRLFGEDEAKSLSPWKKLSQREFTMMNKTQNTYEISGVGILDYIELYRKFADGGASKESYKLDYIASVEIGENKVNYGEYGNLFGLYKQNFQKFIEYNIHDVRLVDKLDKKLQLISLALTLAYDSKCNYQDVFMQVRMWDTLIYNKLKSRKIIVPPQKEHTKTPYEGAFVKDPQVGKHKWVVSFDLTSLYPHLIRHYNISPDMFIEPKDYNEDMRMITDQNISVDTLLSKSIDTSVLRRNDITLTPNNHLFRISERGFLSEMMMEMYNDRDMYKKKKIEYDKLLQKETDNAKREELQKKISTYNNLQLAKKVCLNSAYGAIGSEYFRFFDTRQAAAITFSGQLAIRWIEKALNAYVNKLLNSNNKDYIIAIDTDSVYIDFEDLVNKVFEDQSDPKKIVKWLDKVCQEKIQPYIDKSYQEMKDYLNAFEQAMKMKREAICDSAIWTAKKRYILSVHNNEGVEYKEPKIKVTGLESVKSSTPTNCRETIKKLLPIIMSGTEKEVQKFIANYRKEFENLPIEDISFPRGVSSVKEFVEVNGECKKGTPVHSRGAITFNSFIERNNLKKTVKPIEDGDKIKFVYLAVPNPFRSHVVAFPGEVPKEIEIKKWIDYNVQFEKSFLGAINIILNAIGWSAEEPEPSLEDLFA